MLHGPQRALLATPDTGWGTAYDQKVLTYAPTAYWPLDELTGVAVLDRSGTGLPDGTNTGATVGQPGIGDGATSYLFDGLNDYVNVFSPALAAVFDGAEGSILAWVKVFNAGVWSDGQYRYAIYPNVGVNDYWNVARSTGAGRMLDRIASGGVSKSSNLATGSPLGFVMHTLTVSETADEFKIYWDATPKATHNGLGNFVNPITAFLIGAASGAPVWVWYGYIAKVAYWAGTILQQADITDLATV